MLVGSFFSWWYGVGWLTLMRKTGARITGVLRFFSVTQLLGSLFAPFRQISAGSMQGGTLAVQLRAWGDKQFSRVIGAIVRSMLIICGVAGALFYAVVGLVLFIFWPLLPALPLVGFLLMVTGFKL
ncbi:MAG TPA: hypothetical protein VLG40_02935 [Candidatus Saccharimonas sp.]|nr:hypothetical protein [Candidatus Saccharimonas sp.]